MLRRNRIFILLFIMILSSCSKDRMQTGSMTKGYRIAVVMPSDRQESWERATSWALENIKEAQASLQSKVEISIDWYDENSTDLETVLKSISENNAYAAIVGPHSSTHAMKLAEACAESGKTLILPVATSTELQRIYSDTGNIWFLSQPDISQCELLLTQAVISQSTNVSLLTSDDDYGKSFSDWFAYQAVELGLEVDRVITVSSEDQVKAAVDLIHENYHLGQHLILALSDEKYAEAFDSQLGLLMENNLYLSFPLITCSDALCTQNLKTKMTAVSYEGVSPGADPVSGFDTAYSLRYGSGPEVGTAHLFDAIMLLSFALTITQGDLDEAILEVVDGRERGYTSWLPNDLTSVYMQLQNGGRPDVAGVTGDWTFDQRHHSGVLNTIYSHWVLQDGEYTTVEYLSADGGSRTSSTLQIWDIQQREFQSFDQNQQAISYPEASDVKWAVVIGASDTWGNYRHQADALAMYQLLLRHGYDDDHIILIIADNIAYDPHNIYPGTVRVRPDGENVYENVNVDYKLEGINIYDLKNIMSGQKSTKLPKVISSGQNDNVIVFWCGHGAKNSLMWGSYDVVYGFQVKEAIKSMNFRKMLWVMDACYSGTIGQDCEGIPGLLLITSANAYEPSKADMKDPEMGIWLSNGFTRAFQETVDRHPDITLRDLYYSLARHTVGSHATVYNIENYGNMYTDTLSEFLAAN